MEISLRAKSKYVDGIYLLYADLKDVNENISGYELLKKDSSYPVIIDGMKINASDDQIYDIDLDISKFKILEFKKRVIILVDAWNASKEDWYGEW